MEFPVARNKFPADIDDKSIVPSCSYMRDSYTGFQLDLFDEKGRDKKTGNTQRKG
jgi:hypothetical protein